jgi:hypothetical protein
VGGGFPIEGVVPLAQIDPATMEPVPPRSISGSLTTHLGEQTTVYTWDLEQRDATGPGV